MGRSSMQHTTNGSEEYYISLGGTRLQTRRYGKGRDRKIWEFGKHHKKKITLDGTGGEDGGEKTGYTGHDSSPEGKRSRGRPQKNWQETIREDIRWVDMTW